jgi:hypothetical protein
LGPAKAAGAGFGAPRGLGAALRRYRGVVIRRLPILVVLVAGLAIAGCGSSSKGADPGTTTTVDAGHPPSSQPSASSKMICSKEAQTDIAASIGVKAKVSTPTWVNDVYSCGYTYSAGVITLSVKENDNAAETTKEYNADAAKLGRRPAVVSFGQGAYITTNGSVIVRKDFKVLDVDVSKIPLKFGSPAQDRSDVALSIAATVMSCWTGA